MSKWKFCSQEFKQEALSLVIDQGYTCGEAARSLGVNPSLIARWKRELESGSSSFQGQGKLTPDQQRIKELEAENRRLKMEKDILKKATAIYGEPSSCRKNHEISIYRNAQEGLARESHVSGAPGCA